MIRSTPTFRTAVMLALLLVGCTPFVRSQTPDPPPQTVEEALHRMSDLAGVIFLGEVLAIRHESGQQGASGIVEVDFRIDQAIRGCTGSGIYTLREWAGLWEGGDERYRIGQRLLMMLHSPGAAGISSPVDGMNGAIPVQADSSTSQLLSAADASGPRPLAADLRWVATQVVRPTPYASETQPTAGAASVRASQDIPDSARQTSLSVVVGMLSSWQQAIP